MRFGHQREQGHGRVKLHVIGVAENIRRRPPLNGKNRFRALHEPWTENGMAEILPRFFQAFDGLKSRCGAVPQSVDLREYKPHPVRSLQAAPQLGKGTVINPFLRADEAV